ncbi:uncharacterized protein LOC122158415 isoform X2 [Centrocercus urophasianus]|uniref:uncharacterized protein LOC122158415 isoform X2 n=1 Tax=Centrocercus urophasianus TaxID=9002 RepID=UPI001C64F9D5|nr:uncharacterized protein LOC122158415 isoform X2 [Centrocercus urophasianus]
MSSLPDKWIGFVSSVGASYLKDFCQKGFKSKRAHQTSGWSSAQATDLTQFLSPESLPAAGAHSRHKIDSTDSRDWWWPGCRSGHQGERAPSQTVPPMLPNSGIPLHSPAMPFALLSLKTWPSIEGSQRTAEPQHKAQSQHQLQEEHAPNPRHSHSKGWALCCPWRRVQHRKDPGTREAKVVQSLAWVCGAICHRRSTMPDS